VTSWFAFLDMCGNTCEDCKRTAQVEFDTFFFHDKQKLLYGFTGV